MLKLWNSHLLRVAYRRIVGRFILPTAIPAMRELLDFESTGNQLPGKIIWKQLHTGVDSLATGDGVLLSYVFSAILLQQLSKSHLHLLEKDMYLVARALREFFLIHARTAPAIIGMPSKVVDDPWHEFILDTNECGQFCKAAFGSLFHYIPARSMTRTKAGNEPLKRTWRLTCLEDSISRTRPTRLLLPFAIVEKRGVSNGFTYSLPSEKRVSTRKSDGSSGGDSVSCGGASDGHRSSVESLYGDSGSDSGGGCSGACGGG